MTKTDLAASPQRVRLIGALVAIVVIVADQISKYWILNDVMAPPRAIEVTPFFNLVLAWNRGVSFGLFNTETDYGPMLLTALALIIVVVLAVWMWRTSSRFTSLALGLIIGGALGNVFDRLQHGAVVDFLDLHAFGYHWPAFNVADSAICVGAVMMVVESLFRPDQKA